MKTKKPKSPTPSLSLKQLYKFAHRYHVVMFTVVVIGGLAIVMFMLNNTIQSSTDTNSVDAVPIQTGFDQDTIDKLDSLKMNSNASEQLQFPPGRINPFVE